MLFKYQALTQEGDERSGTIEALNEDVAINSLHEKDLTVVSIESAEKKPFWEKTLWLERISKRDVVILSRQLATLFAAGVSALRVFRLVAQEIENPPLRAKLTQIGDDIQGGASISDALAKHPSVFSDFYVNMVRVGEESGMLNDIFESLADYLNRSQGLTRKIRNALMYPAFVVVVFIGVMVLMLTMVFPRLAQILVESGQDIPVYTQIVIGISSFLTNYGLFILILLAFGGVFWWYFLRKRTGREILSHLLLSVPAVDSLFKRFYIARIADSMHTLLSSGVPLVRTLEVSSVVVGNTVYKSILETAVDEVRAGNSASSVFDQYEQMPSIFVQIVRAGEETGELSTVLNTLSRFYQDEVDAAVDTVVGLIEPVLMVLLGLGVGLILASVLVPIYSLTGGF